MRERLEVLIESVCLAPHVHCRGDNLHSRLLAAPCRSSSFRMSTEEIIEQIKALPDSERAVIARFLQERDDSWIPASFKG